MLTTRIDVDDRLTRIKALVETRLKGGQPAFPNVALFFSVSDGSARARVVSACGKSLEAAWQKGISALRVEMKSEKLQGRWIRVDWVTHVTPTTWQDLRLRLQRTKRNYFRYGLALDRELSFAFTEQELNANAMLYGGNSISYAVVNEKNFSIYARAKYTDLPFTLFGDDDEVFLLSTEGVFCDEDGALYELNGTGRDSSRRHITQLTADDVLSLIHSASEYLARQVSRDGAFVYGYHPCFDRRIAAYNALRHASTTYAMIEAWEVTRDATLKEAIDQALNYLTESLIRPIGLSAGSEAAFLVDVGGEIKLGGNAVAILALTKYSTVTRTKTYLPVAEKLANGIQFMQNQADGSFVHVLSYPDLSVKERFRTIYYEGEAAFGLMRIYELTRDERWLEAVKKAFEHFIAQEHWKHHDHWLSYCVNELTRYRPDERYFRFGIRNVATYLDFVLERITTFPTLLELMMAAERMIARIRKRPEYRHLLDEIDLEKFYRALHVRAHYLLNGHFWPELAMYYRNPARVVGSFFIRHHAFRVRIDDVEHYLSGFIAYRKFLLRGRAPAFQKDETADAPERSRTADPLSIGFLMYPRSPKGFREVKMLAEKSVRQGLKPFYASYKDAKIVDGKLNGYAFEDGRWKEAHFNIPAIIENAPPRRKAEDALFNQLASETFLTCHKLGGKQKTSSLLAAHPETREWLIPSTILSAETLETTLKDDRKAILKPARSNRGRGVYLLEQEDDGMVSVRTNDSVTRMDADDLRVFITQRSNGRWIVQKYIASVDANGRPFDIRVPLFRSGGDGWKAARIYARVGSGRVTSNLATGGSGYDAVTFLSELYGEEAAGTLVVSLEQAARKIAQVLQENYDFLIDALGCDFGIADGRAYFFEVNSYPGMKGCLETATDLKAGYYAALSRVWRKAGGTTTTNKLENSGSSGMQLYLSQKSPDREALSPRAGGAATEANRVLPQKVAAAGGAKVQRAGTLAGGSDSNVAKILADTTGGDWIGEERPRSGTMRLTSRPVPRGVKSFVIARDPDFSFGLSTKWISGHKRRVLGVIGRAPEPPVTGIPYLRVADTQEAFLAIARYHRNLFNGLVYGIVGSTGKTTCANMLARVLRHVLDDRVFVGTRNKPLSIAAQLTRAPQDAGCWMFEMAGANMLGNETGALASARLVQPKACLFTMLTPAHMDVMGTLESAADRKAAAFQGIAAGGTAVINRDMPLAERVLSHVPAGIRSVTYGTHPEADFLLESYDPVSGEVLTRIMGEPFSYRLAVEGIHMATNSLGVLAMCWSTGLDWKRAASGLEQWTPIKGRGRRFSVPWGEGQIQIIDEAYNANPGSMSSALCLLADSRAEGRRIALIGEMLELGDDAGFYHGKVAEEEALKRIDKVYAVGALYEQFWNELPENKRGAMSSTVEEIEEAVLSALHEGDVLMVKGSNGTRLHEMVTRLEERR